MEPWIDYQLPPELVAQEPLPNRGDARLMLVDRSRGTLQHFHIRDLPQLLEPGDRLVMNDTKVIPAQLRGLRSNTGGRWQGLFLGATESGEWKLLCKTRGRLQPMEKVTLLDRDGQPAAQLWLLEPTGDGEWLARPESELAPHDLLDQIGRVPLPPYIRSGQMVDSDVQDYQTVFARKPGAVAAPTAGLHFTTDLLKAIEQSGVSFSAVTLHVGRGTFRPIDVEEVDQHPMHSEWAALTSLAAQEINASRAAGQRVIAVGTTVTRVLESAAAAAVDSAMTAEESGIVAGEEDLGSREPSDTDEALKLSQWRGETSLFIRPPYKFQAIDALLTNFHFPRTTLLLLVQAFGTTELIRAAYEEAIREEYRFYSYGDAMLIV